MTSERSVLKEALLYPWNDGESGTTLVGGGVLTLLSPLVVPALLVLGYNLRVVEAVLDGEDHPPRFEGWGGLLVDGIKAAVVLLGYVVAPMALGTALLAVLAGAAGFRFRGGPPTISGGLAVGGLAFIVALLLAGLALLVWYLAPAALVHLGRTRRLRAAFALDDLRKLVEADAYGSMWLLAVGIFAANAVVLLVLNAAGAGSSSAVSFRSTRSLRRLSCTLRGRPRPGSRSRRQRHPRMIRPKVNRPSTKRPSAVPVLVDSNRPPVRTRPAAPCFQFHSGCPGYIREAGQTVR